MRLRDEKDRVQALPQMLRHTGQQIMILHCFQSYQQITQKISEKIQKTYVSAPRSDAFWYV